MEGDVGHSNTVEQNDTSSAVDEAQPSVSRTGFYAGNNVANTLALQAGLNLSTTGDHERMRNFQSEVYSQGLRDFYKSYDYASHERNLDHYKAYADHMRNQDLVQSERLMMKNYENVTMHSTDNHEHVQSLYTASANNGVNPVDDRIRYYSDVGAKDRFENNENVSHDERMKPLPVEVPSEQTLDNYEDISSDERTGNGDDAVYGANIENIKDEGSKPAATEHYTNEQNVNMGSNEVQSQVIATENNSHEEHGELHSYQQMKAAIPENEYSNESHAEILDTTSSKPDNEQNSSTVSQISIAENASDNIELPRTVLKEANECETPESNTCQHDYMAQQDAHKFRDDCEQDGESTAIDESDVDATATTTKNDTEMLPTDFVETRKEETSLDHELQSLRREVELKYANFSEDSQANIGATNLENDLPAISPEEGEEDQTKNDTTMNISDVTDTGDIPEDKNEADATNADEKSETIKEEPEGENSQVTPRSKSSRKAARKALRQISSYVDDVMAEGATDLYDKSRSCKCCDGVFATHEEYAHHVVMYFGVGQPTIMYKCQYCCHCFESLVELKTHAKEHNEGTPVLCMICDQPFKDRSELAEHLASHNCGNTDAVGADDSDNTVDNFGNFDESLTSINTLASLAVNKFLKSDIKLEPPTEFPIPDDSVIEEMKQKKGRYKCKWCAKIYKGKTGLKKHLRFCSKEQPAMKCRYCGKIFKEESNWKRHEGMHIGIRPHKCPLCEKAYSQKKHLKSHMVTHSGIKGKYACDQCDKSFSDNHGLKRHKMRHTDERPFQCTRCERKFREASDLRMHERYHDNIRPFKCTECDKAYVKGSHLRQHMKSVHTGEMRFFCSYCDKAYHSSQSCKRHEMTHTGERPYKCQYCEKGYTEAADRNYHELTHTGERPHACGECDKTFLRKSHLNAHMASHRSERNFSCEKCGKRFTSIYGLRKHGQIHDGIKKYSCEYCGKMFRESRNLKVHQMTHTGEKPHGCTVCDKRFITAGELKMHTRIHTGEKPNTCEYCGMVFSQKGNLSRHLLRHTGDRPLKCEECGKGFIERQELKAHILNHAGMKPYKCEHCGLGFVRKHHLTKHYRTHTGIKPHCCEFCGKSFTERYNLQTHRVIHTGVKPHPCPFCPQGFIRKGHLRRHVKESHPDKELDDTPNFYIERSPNKPMKEPIVFSQEDIMKTLPKVFTEAAAAAAAASQQVSNSQVSSPGEQNDSQQQKADSNDMVSSYQEAAAYRRPPYLPEMDLQHAYPQLHPSMMQQYGAPANMLPISTPEGLLNRLNEMHNNPGAYPHPNIFPL